MRMTTLLREREGPVERQFSSESQQILKLVALAMPTFISFQVGGLAKIFEPPIT